jgi:aspartyl-tRNA(Asn)/glutamyl-tRNA(Gln) amidotransferase subunit B
VPTVLGGDVQAVSSFDRKHYFYADLPHGFQITQQRAPVVLGGHLDVFVPAPPPTKTKTKTKKGEKALPPPPPPAPPRRLRIERLQLEMDTGKSTR